MLRRLPLKERMWGVRTLMMNNSNDPRYLKNKPSMVTVEVSFTKPITEPTVQELESINIEFLNDKIIYKGGP